MRDYDDASMVMSGHPSAVLVPAIVAAPESSHASDRQVSPAFYAGFEVWVKIARAVSIDRYQTRVACRLTLGTISAAAAVSNLRLLELEVVHALDRRVAGVGQPAGVRHDGEGLPGGNCCRGQASRRLASRTRDSWRRASALDVEDGGFRSLYCMSHHANRSTSSFGHWAMRRASCSPVASRSALAATLRDPRTIAFALELRQEYALSANEVVRGRGQTNSHGVESLIHYRPTTGLEAKFRMEFAVATALLDGWRWGSAAPL
ncbi:MmgE/PrpD family protein [Nocardioides sp. KIGAM211]|uniref:MmgE/PrpD family protein n=1 Tax=Nocardioides luti TaxID=2761101 RepID=A0A7X0VBU3_9ACTN|nr:MmgE/PrpD family protein [Nocardioides luti]